MTKKPILQITGKDGNAFNVLGLAMKVAKKHPEMDWDAIRKEAMSGDYQNLLYTLTKYFDVR